MKKLTKAELIREAAGVFKQYPDVEEVIAVTDGNIFLPNAKGHARNHARTTGHTTMVITRDDANSPAKSEPKNSNPQKTQETGKETVTGQASGEPEGTRETDKETVTGKTTAPAKKPDARSLAKEGKDKEKAAKTGNRKKDTQNHID